MSFLTRLFFRNLRENPVEKSAGNPLVGANEATRISMQGYINANVLNVRSQPEKGENVLGKLSRGAVVDIYEKTNSDWYKIKYNNASAYVTAEFVAFKQGKVNANALNMRSQPDMNAEVLNKLKRDDKVTILLTLTDWYKVEYQGKVGYMASKFVVIGAAADTDKNDKPTKKFLKDKAALLRVKLEPKSKVIVPTASREGRITAETYNNFGGLLEVLSDEINIDIATAIAVLAVESGGKGFGAQGNVLIRFENHLFHSFWGKNNEKVYNQHFRFSSAERWKNHFFRKDKNSEWQAYHGDQVKEWEVLTFARSLDNEKALFSASYGLPQVIGSNHKVIGYKNAQAMLDGFSEDIRYHVLALFDFFNPQMIKHLQRKEFTDFARYYNGGGQAVRYGNFIKRHYDAFKKIK